MDAPYCNLPVLSLEATSNSPEFKRVKSSIWMYPTMLPEMFHVLLQKSYTTPTSIIVQSLKLRMVIANCELRIANSEFRQVNCELRIVNF